MSCDPSKVVGYHGTLLDRANEIRRVGFRKSRKPVEWLGFGVYFFADRSDAEYWARKEARRCGVAGETRHAPAVIIIELETGENGLLDLDLPGVRTQFTAELGRMYDEIFGDGGRGAPRFKDERESRCFWCNCYKNRHPELKVIAFSFPLERFDRFGFPAARRQLCAVDRACICMPPRKVEVLS